MVAEGTWSAKLAKPCSKPDITMRCVSWMLCKQHGVPSPESRVQPCAHKTQKSELQTVPVPHCLPLAENQGVSVRVLNKCHQGTEQPKLLWTK